MRHALDLNKGTWTAPDVTVDDLRAYATTGRRLGFTWPTRLLFRLCATILDRYDRGHRSNT